MAEERSFVRFKEYLTYSPHMLNHENGKGKGDRESCVL